MIEAKKGVPQKDALSCSVNIFCEKVILSTESVSEAIKKGNLAAFADDYSSQRTQKRRTVIINKAKYKILKMEGN